MKASIRCLGLTAMLCIPTAEAVNKEIRASFAPDSSHPHKNEFINKTPNSGYCTIDPSQCTDNNMFSIQLPVRFDSSRPIGMGEQVRLKVPANWRPLTVINRDTQEAETVEVRIIGIGSEYVLSHTAAELVGVTDILEGHQKLWLNSSWVYAPAPCQYSGVGRYAPKHYRFFWKAPLEAACVKIAAYGIPSMSFNTLDFAYELRTPNPLKMSSGLYTGSMVYRMGPGGDFDLGPVMVPDDGNLTLDFVLDVEHTLKVDIPPGGSKVELQPAGGWQSWLQAGRMPTRLFRDQTFLISASSKFTMRLECEHQVKQGCGIIAGGYGGMVNVSVSLPGGLTDKTGKPVKNFALSQQESIAFQPGHYIDRKPGTLHFEIPPADTAWLISNNKGLPYKGNIAVIWDSDI